MTRLPLPPANTAQSSSSVPCVLWLVSRHTLWQDEEVLLSQELPLPILRSPFLGINEPTKPLRSGKGCPHVAFYLADSLSLSVVTCSILKRECCSSGVLSFSTGPTLCSFGLDPFYCLLCGDSFRKDRTACISRVCCPTGLHPLMKSTWGGSD